MLRCGVNVLDKLADMWYNTGRNGGLTPGYREETRYMFIRRTPNGDGQTMRQLHFFDIRQRAGAGDAYLQAGKGALRAMEDPRAAGKVREFSPVKGGKCR